MSHISTVKTQIKNKTALNLTCLRLGLPAPQHRKIYVGGEEVTGEVTRLKGWIKETCFDLETGEVHYDNYNGVWGHIDRLHEFQQTYGLEAAKLQLSQQYPGMQFTEQQVSDGAVLLQGVSY